MKFIGAVLVALVTLIPSSSLAEGDEVTVIGTLKAHETKLRGIDIMAGKSIVDVYPADDKAKISCQYIDANGKVGLDQADVNICRGAANLSLPWHLTVKVTNLQDKEIDYRIHVYPTK